MDWNRKRIDCKMTGTVSLDELRRHATSNDAWTIYEGQVYDITPYLDYTPAVCKCLEGSFGSDCTRAAKAHRWVNGHAPWASAAWGLWRGRTAPYLLKRRTRTTEVTQQRQKARELAPPLLGLLLALPLLQRPSACASLPFLQLSPSVPVYTLDARALGLGLHRVLRLRGGL